MAALPPVTKRPDPIIGKLKEVMALVGKGDLAAAEAAARRIQQAEPGHADANNILGIVLINRKNPTEAVKYLGLAARKDPSNAIYLNNLGCAYLDLGLIELAQAPLERAFVLNPKLTKTSWLLGEFYRLAGKPERALPYHEMACRNEPQNAEYKFALGKTLEMLDQTEDARACFESLRRHPVHGNFALYRLAVNGRHDLSSPLLAEIEDKLFIPPANRRALNALHVGAARIREQNGDYVRAFTHYRKANEADRIRFDLGPYRAWINSLIATFTPEVIARHQGKGSDSDLPVFVVGMPRSGTTLVEQIIGRHPQAVGAGELDRIWRIAGNAQYRSDVGKFLSIFAAAEGPKMAAMAESYVKLLKFFGPDARRVVDKMPHNFEFLGLIALSWPNARVVHMRRNAVDTCLSCYQNRLTDAHGYSRDLTILGLYYREYARLMDHWRRVLPLKFLDVDYEKLTSDFEAEARRLIAFLDLDWDPACLTFHEGTSAVRTFSRNQVRKPIYQSSVGRWRNYETQLQPLITALGDRA
ncbi:tetratricopeptide repeat protein [Nordella sp. HKS 07]|uniref:tetratricopeptide repeat-containing sulfotransferase family protein n=1 Tax=Nordella sp. HKS 07 TaxID=2712222 RepID=UPI0013E19967|nr:sulfotransferase [Nordella sp. HKS 07]QIG51406.1 tetratricopeptide repeat protein [Nordella sp. HKS 07]